MMPFSVGKLEEEWPNDDSPDAAYLMTAKSAPHFNDIGPLSPSASVTSSSADLDSLLSVDQIGFFTRVTQYLQRRIQQ